MSMPRSLISSRLTPDLVGRFWGRVYAPRQGDCWLFVTRANPYTYPLLANMPVHRVSWFLENGSEPSAMMVCHTCDTRHCVNPSHLWLGRGVDNYADMVAKGRRRTKFKAEKQLGTGEHLRAEPGYQQILERVEAEARAIGTANLRRAAVAFG